VQRRPSPKVSLTIILPPPSTTMPPPIGPYKHLNFDPSGPQGKHIKSITNGRFSNFLGGHYASSNLTSTLVLDRDDSPSAVKLEVWSPKAGEKPSFEEAKGQKYKPAKKGDRFGPSCERLAASSSSSTHD
jgi:alpha-mannosidase